MAPRLAGLLLGRVMILGPASLGLLRALASSADRILLVGPDRPALQLQRRALAEHQMDEVDAVVAHPSSLPLRPWHSGGAVLIAPTGRLDPEVRTEVERIMGAEPVLAIVPAGAFGDPGGRDPSGDGRGDPRQTQVLASARGLDLVVLGGRLSRPQAPAPERESPSTQRPPHAQSHSPAIAVIIPTRNRARLLPRALASVLAQQVAPAEILVVDDGSNDDTETVIRSYGPRVRLLKQEPAGQAAAMNAGIAAARGDWIAWLDDDDFFLPAKLRLQLRTLDDQQVGLAVTAHYIGNSDGQPYEARPVPEFGEHNLLRLLLRGSIFLGPTAIVRRDAYAELGDHPYDETLPRAADYAVWWQLARRRRVAVLQVPLTVVCRHPGNQLDLARARAIYESVRRTLRWAWENVPLAELAAGRADVAEVRLERAAALLRAGLWAEARADLETARDLDPERAGNLLGLAALESGDLAAAEQHFSSVLRHAPGSLEAMNGLATAHLFGGRRADAERILARALASQPRDPLTRYNAALAGESSPTTPGPALRLARDLLAERGIRGAHYSPAPPLSGIDAFFVALRRVASLGVQTDGPLSTS